MDAGTLVHPLDSDSPLVNAGGPVAGCPSVDQRGVPRPAGSTCDVGAYEYQGTSAAIVIATPGTPDIIPLWTDTPTPTPGVILFVLNKNANCRRGPGGVYDVVTSYLAGESFTPDGRNQASTWVRLKINQTARCWVSIENGDFNGDLSLLPVLVDPPTPTPTSVPDQGGGGSGGIDYDKDGYTSDKDCNDKNAKIHPGAAETPDDKVDSNCNGNDDN
jgi:hypothetical protein